MKVHAVSTMYMLWLLSTFAEAKQSDHRPAAGSWPPRCTFERSAGTLQTPSVPALVPMLISHSPDCVCKAAAIECATSSWAMPACNACSRTSCQPDSAPSVGLASFAKTCAATGCGDAASPASTAWRAMHMPAFKVTPCSFHTCTEGWHSWPGAHQLRALDAWLDPAQANASACP